jgi:hypothetical protein
VVASSGRSDDDPHPPVPVPTPVPAPPPAPDEAVASDDAKPTAATAEEKAKRLAEIETELARALGGVKSLRARFTQRKHLDVFEDDVESSGTVALADPDKLRWEISLPVESTLIVNGERALRRRTSRRGRTTETRFRLADDPVAAGTARQIFLWMRGDLAAARKDYALTLVSEKPLRIRAVPLSKELAKVVAAVEIQFADDRRSPPLRSPPADGACLPRAESGRESGPAIPAGRTV